MCTDQSAAATSVAAGGLGVGGKRHLFQKMNQDRSFCRIICYTVVYKLCSNAKKDGCRGVYLL